ncbi:hypothetical protein HYQ45_005122 [Verticillium longisporum]|uniref:Uncharacterized protein n=1 Tax=Verticillium longisporum TaxID=100787 RepID=A0A8I2ZTJ2_VERLO|nr:hypothetical protein HYQ45_005122 [Verticillium longisporum]
MTGPQTHLGGFGDLLKRPSSQFFRTIPLSLSRGKLLLTVSAYSTWDVSNIAPKAGKRHASQPPVSTIRHNHPSQQFWF